MSHLSQATPSNNPATNDGPIHAGHAPAVEQSAHFVTAPLTYVVDTGEKPVTQVFPPGEGESIRGGQHAEHLVQIRNGRRLVPAPALDREGFALIRAASAVSDFSDGKTILDVYYPEVERLVKQATGATKVIVFDHNLRVDGGLDGHLKGLRTPVRLAHNDYTEESAPRRAGELVDPADAETLLKQRFAVINLWRPIHGPVETAPLAFADAQSVASKDLVATDLVYRDRTGEIYEVAYNPDQRWVYFPDMERDEAVLIKGYDSTRDGRARYTPHTAFDDPTSGPDAAPRESIEVRTLAFFGPETVS